jgi:glycosyltransferase involved in cell wall biosynthesis
MNKHLVITGTRGIPASHGGFETFAEQLALHMHKQGWEVTIYCQSDQTFEDTWNGIRRIHCSPSAFRLFFYGAFGTALFDLKSLWHARKLRRAIILTLGYNTAFFNIFLWFFRRIQIINMDGLEWKRQKWKSWVKFYLWINYYIAGYIGTRLIADHIEIHKILSKSFNDTKIQTIAYGSYPITHADKKLLINYGLSINQYVLVIARPEPENGLLEIVQTWSKVKRPYKLVILGRYNPNNPYHSSVISHASEDVIFLGAVYNQDVLKALRVYCLVHIHGHTVGGTNPSLVEALGAGCAIIAHDNVFNRGVADQAAFYYKTMNDLENLLNKLSNDQLILDNKRNNARKQHAAYFTWPRILEQYETLFNQL